MKRRSSDEEEWCPSFGIPDSLGPRGFRLVLCFIPIATTTK
jgi:hypothetical protein